MCVGRCGYEGRVCITGVGWDDVLGCVEEEDVREGRV